MKYNRYDEVLYKTAFYSMKLAMAGTKIENVTLQKIDCVSYIKMLKCLKKMRVNCIS